MEHTDSKEVSRGSCEACGSSDANISYSDGHTYCFSCTAYTKGDTEDMQYTKPAPIQPNAKRAINNWVKLSAKAKTKQGIEQIANKRLYRIIGTDFKTCVRAYVVCKKYFCMESNQMLP